MPCFQPRTAWKIPGKSKLQLGNTPPRGDSTQMNVACQQCIGCQQTNARNWAFRCEMELADHMDATFTTLTIEDLDREPTLNVETVQRFLKRLRERHSRLHPEAWHDRVFRPIRHFLAGEYGTHNKRPHYHAILFGCNADTHGPIIQEAWGLGYTQTYPVSPASIAYTAGYAAKKARWTHNTLTTERVNPHTGEVYTQQPEFIITSRIPHGIGGNMRHHFNSWRTTAIYDGLEMPVPRYYHQAWKDNTTPIDWLKLNYEKQIKREKREQSGNYHPQRIQAAQLIAEHKLQQQTNKRSL